MWALGWVPRWASAPWQGELAAYAPLVGALAAAYVRVVGAFGGLGRWASAGWQAASAASAASCSLVEACAEGACCGASGALGASLVVVPHWASTGWAPCDASAASSFHVVGVSCWPSVDCVWPYSESAAGALAVASWVLVDGLRSAQLATV